MRINEAAERCQLPKKTIKYYEEEELIIPDRNSTNNYREYNEDHIRVLREVKLLRKLGFSIDNIRMILNHPDQLKEIFEHHIRDVDTQLNSLKKTKDICSDIMRDNLKSDSVDFANYLDKISNMEQEGYQFMDENRKEKKFKRDSKLTLLFIVITMLIIGGAVSIIDDKTLLGVIAIGLIGVASLGFLVYWHSATRAYICKHCEGKFEIGFFIDLVSLQMPPNKKYLKCPYCGKRSWAKESFRD